MNKAEREKDNSQDQTRPRAGRTHVEQRVGRAPAVVSLCELLQCLTRSRVAGQTHVDAEREGGGPRRKPVERQGSHEPSLTPPRPVSSASFDPLERQGSHGPSLREGCGGACGGSERQDPARPASIPAAWMEAASSRPFVCRRGKGSKVAEPVVASFLCRGLPRAGPTSRASVEQAPRGRLEPSLTGRGMATAARQILGCTCPYLPEGCCPTYRGLEPLNEVRGRFKQHSAIAAILDDGRNTRQ